MTKFFKKNILIGIMGISILFNTGCASCERLGKDLSSEFGNGLNRSVYVYDMTGNLIKTYKGNIDIQESEGNKIKFDISDNNNQRIIIYNAIVIVEEEGK